MTTAVAYHRIESTPGICGGKPRIAGRRITVQNVVVWHEHLGKSSDEIASEHALSLADIHSALAYYFDNREEIDRSISEGQAFAESLKAGNASRINAKLKAISDAG